MPHDTVLNGVAETLLIPLWARAEESLRPDGLVRDVWALRLRSRLDYDFSRMAGGWKTQLGIAIRTWILDREVTGYLARYPSGTVVTLGCGLDARSLRLDNGAASWIDLDLPEAIALHRTLLPSGGRHRLVAMSVLDPAWLDWVPQDPPPLFVAEGLFMYLPEDGLRDLVSALASRFPGGTVLAEILSRARAADTSGHDLVSRFDARFAFGLDDGRDFETWHPSVRLTAQWSHMSFCRARWRWLRWLAWLPIAQRAARICRLELGQKAVPPARGRGGMGDGSHGH